MSVLMCCLIPNSACETLAALCSRFSTDLADLEDEGRGECKTSSVVWPLVVTGESGGGRFAEVRVLPSKVDSPGARPSSSGS